MNSDNNWILQLDPLIHKELASISRKDRERIFNVIDSLSINPFAGDIQKMRGEKNVWRRRVGAYRIFYELVSVDRLVHVFRVERRSSKTY